MSFCCVTVDDSEVGLIFVFQDFLPFKPPLIELLEVDAVVEVGVVGVPRKRRDLAILWCELVFCNFRELKKQPLLHDFLYFYFQFISYWKCFNCRRISKLLLNFGCLFTFCYLDGVNSIKTDLHICNLWTDQSVI